MRLGQSRPVCRAACQSTERHGAPTEKMLGIQDADHALDASGKTKCGTTNLSVVPFRERRRAEQGRAAPAGVVACVAPQGRSGRDRAAAKAECRARPTRRRAILRRAVRSPERGDPEPTQGRRQGSSPSGRRNSRTDSRATRDSPRSRPCKPPVLRFAARRGGNDGYSADVRMASGSRIASAHTWYPSSLK
jgi:hypothetical protein